MRSGIIGAADFGGTLVPRLRAPGHDVSDARRALASSPCARPSGSRAPARDAATV